MTLDPKALAVFLDAARECFGELAPEVAKWVEHPEAVRELLDFDPVSARGGAEEEFCPACDVHLTTESHGASKRNEHCPVAAAWRALGDPRGAADIERAHEEALREQAGRRSVIVSTPRGSGHGWIDAAHAENDRMTARVSGVFPVRLEGEGPRFQFPGPGDFVGDVGD